MNTIKNGRFSQKTYHFLIEIFEFIAKRHRHSDPFGALYHAAERPYIIYKAYIMQPTAVYHCEASAALSGRANFAARLCIGPSYHTVKLRAGYKTRFILRRRASQRLRRRPPALPSGLPRSSRPPPAPFPARRPAGSRRRAKAPRPPYRRDRRPSRRKAPP